MHSLTLALEEGDWSASRLGRLTPKERALGTHWIGGSHGTRSIVNLSSIRPCGLFPKEINYELLNPLYYLVEVFGRVTGLSQGVCLLASV